MARLAQAKEVCAFNRVKTDQNSSDNYDGDFENDKDFQIPKLSKKLCALSLAMLAIVIVALVRILVSF